MSNTAFQTQFRQELILGHEERKSYLLERVTNEATIKGNTATFLITSSSANTAVTRAINGLIPYQSEDLTQVSCTLQEWHAPFKKTSFNIFASQGDQRRSMQLASSAVINRKLDQLIINQLDTTVQTTGAAKKGSVNLIMHAYAKLGANKAARGALTALISPAFYSYLAQSPEFASVDMSSRKELEVANIEDAYMFQKGMFTYIVHPDLPGAGTANESCFVFNRDSIACAMDTKGLQVALGYNEEQDYSFVRSAFFGNAKLLQGTGVIKVPHDASEYA